MKPLVLVATLALVWAPALSGQAREHRGVQTRVFQYLAMNANSPDGANFGAACAGIRDGDRVIDPRPGILATAGREAQSRDSIWTAVQAEAAEAGDPITWLRPRNSVEVLVPASRCSLLTEALGVDLRSDGQGQVAILMIDEWTTSPDGSFEIRALIGPEPLRYHLCSGWVESPARFSSRCTSEEFANR